MCILVGDGVGVLAWRIPWKGGGGGSSWAAQIGEVVAVVEEEDLRGRAVVVVGVRPSGWREGSEAWMGLLVAARAFCWKSRTCR